MRIDLSGVNHHPAIEEPVSVLCNKTQNTDRTFYRTSMAFFLAKMASSMRVMVSTEFQGKIPVNLYVIGLASSGYGKGHSTGIIEEELLGGFRNRFMNLVAPQITDQNLQSEATKRAVVSGKTVKDELLAVKKEFNSLGPAPFSFDSGTVPAVKQLREKQLLSRVGSINLQIDEIGNNLLANLELLTVGLEMYDRGKVKQKLTKVTAENQRGEDLDGMTPMNMLLYGTPSRLLDGGQTEEQFFAFLDAGYARRCFFAEGVAVKPSNRAKTAQDIYRDLTSQNFDTILKKWAVDFADLADPAMYEWEVEVDEPTAIRLIEYRMDCEEAAEKLPEYEEIRKAELSHRYFKALKLAGALAFADVAQKMSIDNHLMPAILLAEESGESFQRILTREKNYVRLAKIIASHGTEMTHTDILERFPAYGRNNTQRTELMGLAAQWGHRNGITIQKTFQDGMEFFRGKALEPTDLDKLIFSYSDHFAFRYTPETEGSFEMLPKLAEMDGLHWCNHLFREDHRLDEKAKPGFNLIVLDIDGTAKRDVVHELLKEYTFMTYTTKRHKEYLGMDPGTGDDIIGPDRFRLVIPSNYVLELDQEDYRVFMNNVMDWLPFESDEGANQRARKWMTNPNTEVFMNEGVLFDVRNFIPRTSRNEHYQKERQPLQSMPNIERWFAERMVSGSRNNHMIRFALTLVDSGLPYSEVEARVLHFNKSLSAPLGEDELRATVLVTAARKYQ